MKGGNSYRDKVKLIPSILGKFCAGISDENLITIYKEVDREYKDDFWQMLSDYKVYARINPVVFGMLVDEIPRCERYSDYRNTAVMLLTSKATPSHTR